MENASFEDVNIYFSKLDIFLDYREFFSDSESHVRGWYIRDLLKDGVSLHWCLISEDIWRWWAKYQHRENYVGILTASLMMERYFFSTLADQEKLYEWIGGDDSSPLIKESDELYLNFLKESRDLPSNWNDIVLQRHRLGRPRACTPTIECKALIIDYERSLLSACIPRAKIEFFRKRL